MADTMEYRWMTNIGTALLEWDPDNKEIKEIWINMYDGSMGEFLSWASETLKIPPLDIYQSEAMKNCTNLNKYPLVKQEYLDPRIKAQGNLWDVIVDTTGWYKDLVQQLHEGIPVSKIALDLGYDEGYIWKVVTTLRKLYGEGVIPKGKERRVKRIKSKHR